MELAGPALSQEAADLTAGPLRIISGSAARMVRQGGPRRGCRGRRSWRDCRSAHSCRGLASHRRAEHQAGHRLVARRSLRDGHCPGRPGG
eukprot:13295291-Alexandrium_andersonii.AAC.1